jgi:hypothetical protein
MCPTKSDHYSRLILNATNAKTVNTITYVKNRTSTVEFQINTMPIIRRLNRPSPHADMTANNGVKLAFVIAEASIWQPKEAEQNPIFAQLVISLNLVLAGLRLGLKNR